MIRKIGLADIEIWCRFNYESRLGSRKKENAEKDIEFIMVNRTFGEIVFHSAPTRPPADRQNAGRLSSA